SAAVTPASTLGIAALHDALAEALVGAGQAMTGAVLSCTVTLAVHEEDAPLLSVTVKVITVVPTEYGPAGDCASVIASPSGSELPLSTEAGAWQLALAVTVTSLPLAL